MKDSVKRKKGPETGGRIQFAKKKTGGSAEARKTRKRKKLYDLLAKEDKEYADQRLLEVIDQYIIELPVERLRLREKDYGKKAELLLKQEKERHEPVYNFSSDYSRRRVYELTPMVQLDIDIERALTSENGDRKAADLYIENKAVLFDSLDAKIRNSRKEFRLSLKLTCGMKRDSVLSIFSAISPWR
ncbi:MAG: hypothetical protein IKE16_00385 [Solobacterium sp.]|nr:hypothetical protein [Solobacterium sp.]